MNRHAHKKRTRCCEVQYLNSSSDSPILRSVHSESKLSISFLESVEFCEVIREDDFRKPEGIGE